MNIRMSGRIGRWMLALALIPLVGVGVFVHTWVEEPDSIVEEIDLESIGQKIKVIACNDGNKAFIPAFCDETEVDDADQQKGVEIIKTGGIPVMFINTAVGTMKNVYKDKSHKEVCSMQIFDSDGEICANIGALRIKGHGNSTWEKDKKPFSLLFDQPCSLLNMSESSHWVLLANSWDRSGIRNKTILDFVAKIGNGFCIQSEFVELYLDGEYSGMYLLAQAADTIYEYESDIVLGTAELSERITQKNSIELSNGVNVVIKNEINYSSAEFASIMQYLKNVDEAMGQSGSDLARYIDYDSWTNRYLIDEIFENVDSGIASSFFYWKVIDGQSSPIYAGPIWDYDVSMGNPNVFFIGATYDPCIIYAGQNSRGPGLKIMWYNELLQNEEFTQRVRETYGQRYDELKELAGAKLKERYKSIESALYTDSVRWGYDFEEAYEDVEYTQRWLAERIDFLYDIWIAKTNYHCVIVEKDGSQFYKYFYVKDGESLEKQKFFSKAFELAESQTVYNSEGSVVSDFSQSIHDDLYYHIVNNEEKASFKQRLMMDFKYGKEMYLVLGLFGMLMLAVFGMAIREYRLRERE